MMWDISRRNAIIGWLSTMGAWLAYRIRRPAGHGSNDLIINDSASSKRSSHIDTEVVPSIDETMKSSGREKSIELIPTVGTTTIYRYSRDGTLRSITKKESIDHPRV